MRFDPSSEYFGAIFVEFYRSDDQFRSGDLPNKVEDVNPGNRGRSGGEYCDNDVDARERSPS
jgi:hypothetical protein